MRLPLCNFSLTFVLTFVFLTGCSDTERFLSSAEKIHRAFPPSAEVRVALEDAREYFSNEPEHLKILEDRVQTQIQLRSLICTQNMPIGRLDSVEKIKTLPVKPECLAKQDSILADTVGVFRIGKLLTQPPLRPLTSLNDAPVITKMGGLNASHFQAASHANVLLVRGARSGEFASVHIPSGKTLATMPNIQGGSYPQMSVSPNGRLAAVNLNNSRVVFLDMERGNKLWEPSKFTKFYGWLSDVSAVLVHDEESNSPMLVDLITGNLEAYAAAPKNLKWVKSTTEKGKVWIGSVQEVIGVEHVRSDIGIEATVTKVFRLSQSQGITSNTPTLMNNDKTLFFVTLRDFGSLDLETGQETVWNVAGFLANRYAKLSENTLLVESYPSSPRTGINTWVLDITGRTLAAVDDTSTAAVHNGQLIELDGRTGWIRHRNQTTYLGSTVWVEAPQSLDELSSAFKLEQQIAKIEMMESRSPNLAKSDQLNSQDRKYISGSAGIKPPIPAPTIFPKNTHVEAVGVYQGVNSSGILSSEGRKMGIVDVRVRRGSKPIILVLSSYEPVQWKVTLEPGAQLAGVLMSGYYQSQVTGIGSVRVLQMGRTHAYKRGSREYNSLDRQVRSLNGGQGIDVFQGRYEGGSYSVGG